MHRRAAVLAALSLGACAAASDPSPQALAPAGGPTLLTRWRVVGGGFLAPTLVAPPGTPPRAGGMYVKFIAPAALALRGPDLLVADVASARLWRVDAALNQLSGIAGAPVLPGVSVALGPDLSAWVLDSGARQVLRFARDGRLMQTWRAPLAASSPVGLALGDGGSTLLLADGLGAQWADLRGPTSTGVMVAPRTADEGRRITGVDAIAGLGDELLVLDRLAAAVHRVSRDGRVLATLGRGELAQPSVFAVDRAGRVFVIDAANSALVVLREGEPTRRFTAAELGLSRLAAIALDERTLALADSLSGQVALFLIAPEAQR
jgi:streptogramin lyase